MQHFPFRRLILQRAPFTAFIIMYTLLSFSCSKDGGRQVISGEFEHAKGVTVYFSKVTDNGEVVLDSAVTDNNGRFSLQNKADDMDYYLIRISPTAVLYLILDGTEKVSITADANRLENTYSIRGSVESESLHDLKFFERHLTDSLNRLYSQAREADPYHADSVGHALETSYRSMMANYSRHMVRSHLSCLSSLSATKYLDQSNDFVLMETLSDSLNKKLPDNPYVKDYAVLVADLKKLPAGSLAPPIELNTLDCKKMTLASLRGKIVLVDFWASWCKPCRQTNPDLKTLYTKYKGPEFELLGVSLDDDVNDWRAAINADGITWPQVSELKKWDSRCVKDYSIEAIPFSVLIGRDGRIIAKGLQPSDLDQRIQDALKKPS